MKSNERIIKRTSKHVQDYIQTQTEHGLLVDRNPDGHIVDAKLPENAAGEAMDYTMLRPPPEKNMWDTICDDELDNNDTYAIYHRGKLCDLWNSAFKGHRDFDSLCDGDLTWDDDACEKRGLAWLMALKCTKCAFKSPRTKLYDETESDGCGRKAASINTRLQIGLSKQGISNTGMRTVLASLNILPPSASGMQAAANSVGQGIIEANTEDMDKIRGELKQLNEATGRPSSHPIPAEADATYNNKIYSGIGNTPFQAGTQATFLVAENATPSKKIIAAKTYSKLCSCPKDYEHKDSCTANLDPDDSIGNEGEYLRHAIADINKSGVQIGELTMDGDSCSRSTATFIKQPQGANIQPKYCTRHLIRNMERSIQKTEFSKSMFIGKNKAEKDRAHNRFAFDLGDRVNAEYNAAYDSLKGDTTKLKQKLPDITDAIIDCYRGHCGGCIQHSYVCSKKKPWHRSYIDTNERYRHQRAFINPNVEDMTRLRAAMSVRLGDAAVDKTSNNSTQNKCEASNRGVKKAVPNALTFSRNYHARVQSAVHSINNGPGTSLIKLCQHAGAPIPTKSPVNAAMKKIDQQVEYNKKRKKSTDYKVARRSLRQQRYRMYDAKKNVEAGYYCKYAAIGDVLYEPAQLPVHLECHDYMSRKITVLSAPSTSK